jgi:uncharacterized protein (UPF0333 family)
MKETGKGQTAIEYLILVMAIIGFITMIAFIVKNNIFG